MSYISPQSFVTPEKSVDTEDIPVQDSPKTPVTPRSPVDISVASQKISGSVESRPIEGGTWTRLKFSSDPVYDPPSVEVAKRFLRTAFGTKGFELPSGFRQLTSDTPLTSSQPCQDPATCPPAKMQNRVMTCHACHLVMGGGNHNGSAPGKNVCTLKHSNLCLGGIPESDNWKGCPVGYVSNYQSYNVTGFSQTLDDNHFQLAQSSTPAVTPGPGLAFQQSQISGQQQQVPVPHGIFSQGTVTGSPALLGAAGSTTATPGLPPLDRIGSGSSSVLDDDLVAAHRFHRQANGEGARSRVIQERVPSRVTFQNRIVASEHSSSFPQDLEQEVAELRAYNQQAAQLLHQVQDQPHLTIGSIRNEPGLKDTVEQQLSGFRGQAPVLSSAPSAPAPGLPTSGAFFHTPPQFYQQAGDGIRVTGSSPIEGQLGRAGVPSLVQQQLADARAKFAAVRQQGMIADQQLLDWQHQADMAAAQTKAQTDLQHYQQQIMEAEAQLLHSQQALRLLQVGAGQPQRQSVLRQTAAQPGYGHDYVGSAGQTYVQPAQPDFEIVVGTDGRRYKVPKSQMAVVPDFEIVTGSDGQRYKVPRSHMSQIPVSQQSPSLPTQNSDVYP